MTNTFNDKLGRQVLGYAGYYATGAPDTSPLITLAGRLGGQGDEASIGLANFDMDTFEQTKAAHPELAGRSWDELLDDPKLNIDAMAYRMIDLEAMLPAQLNTTHSREELIRRVTAPG